MQVIRFVGLLMVFLKIHNPKITSFSLLLEKILKSGLKHVSLSVEVPEKMEIFPLRIYP